MEAVKKVACGAVGSIRNSPLFKRKFGTPCSTAPNSATGRRQPQAISPEKDTTPFVQGIYFHVDYLGKQAVDSCKAQDHGCTNHAINMLWKFSPDSFVEKRVSVKITTTNIRVKEVNRGKEEATSEPRGVAKILFNFPLFRVSYCGTYEDIPEAFCFVAKDLDAKYYSFVFRCASLDKSHAMTLTVAKAFYLAYQILLEQQGNFPPGPDRELLFEPQCPDDTQEHPHRPDIVDKEASDADMPKAQVTLEVTDSSCEAMPTVVVSHRFLHQSETSEDSEILTRASEDEDFTRLASARSNPDILRSTLDTEDIMGQQLGWVEKLRLHADPGSLMPTPIGSTEHLDQVDDSTYLMLAL